MFHKFTILFLFSVLSSIVEANIYVNETAVAFQIYMESNEKAILNLPKAANDLVLFGKQHLEIDEKLGSYHLDKTNIHKLRKISLQEVNQISPSSLKLIFKALYKRNETSYTVSIFESGANQLSIKLSSLLPEEVNFVKFTIPAQTTAIFGGGVQYSFCNLSGHQFPLIVEENGVGRGDKGTTFLANLLGAAGNHYTTYAPMPNFISSNSLQYTLHNNHKNILWEVDFTEHNKLVFEANLLEENLGKFPELSIQRIEPIQAVSQPNLEKAEEARIQVPWMNGYILGVQGGKQKVDSLIKKLQSNKIIVSGIWIQDWVGKRQTAIGSRLQWDWHPNESYYPNIKQWIDSLHQQNIKVLGYINPYFVEEGIQATEGIVNNYFVQNTDGSSYKFAAGGFNAYMVDLSSQKAFDWIKTIVKTHLLANGFDGWMYDFGEWLPFQEIQLSTDKNTMYHNEFPYYWDKVNREALNEYCAINQLESNRFFLYNRSWYHDNKQSPNLMWLGDQMGNFGTHDGLPSAINGYNSASLSGIPITHSDIGGYTAIKLGPIQNLRNDEILKRWIEFEAFTPIWRSHEGLIPEKMSQIYQDEEMMAFFAYFDSIHHELIHSYFKEAYSDYQINGTPLVRHPFLMHPSDEYTYNLQYQFFVGNNLLVCPVIEKNSSKVEVYLPKGNWHHFFTKEKYLGEQFYTIEAPLGQPAVFTRIED